MKRSNGVQRRRLNKAPLFAWHFMAQLIFSLIRALKSIHETYDLNCVSAQRCSLVYNLQDQEPFFSPLSTPFRLFPIAINTLMQLALLCALLWLHPASLPISSVQLYVFGAETSSRRSRRLRASYPFVNAAREGWAKMKGVLWDWLISIYLLKEREI